MAMKQPGQKTYKTMQGRQIDMDMLRKKNELTPAVGNAKVNARGDELGPGGQIVRRREDVVNDYYKSSQGVPDENTPRSAPAKTVDETVEKEAATETKKKSTAKTKPKTQTKGTEVDQVPTSEEAAEWEEDENGDFVKKGE